MLKDLARDIIPLVNDIDQFARLQKYVNQRLETLRDRLEQPMAHSQTDEIRGAIAELRLFHRLRADVIRDSK